MPKSEKENNSVKFWQNLWKVTQVIYIMYPKCMPDIMILAQGFSRYFVHKVALQHKTTVWKGR